MEGMGGKIVKRYRIYEKQLDRQDAPAEYAVAAEPAAV
jgi:hypothetical protein